MPQNSPNRSNMLFLAKKFTVSIFIAGTFAVYAIHDRLTSSGDPVSLLTPNEIALGSTATSATATDVSTATATVLPATNTYVPTQPTQTPTDIPPTLTPIPSNVPTSVPVVLVVATDVPTDIPTNTPTDLPTITDIPTDTPTKLPTATATKSGRYSNGQYTGGVADAFYGNVQVKVVISNGKITSVQFLDYPHDRQRSQEINNYAMPYLKTEVIKAQSAQVNIISGATLTSEAFIQSLQSALSKASA